MGPFLTLVAVAAVFMGMLNALGHFFVPALSPAMFNVATIVIVASLRPVGATARTPAHRACGHRDADWRAGTTPRFNGRPSRTKGFRIGPRSTSATLRFAVCCC